MVTYQQEEIGAHVPPGLQCSTVPALLKITDVIIRGSFIPLYNEALEVKPKKKSHMKL